MQRPVEPEPDLPEPPTQPPTEPGEAPVEEPNQPPPATALHAPRRRIGIVLH